jgi:hypothetical protein
LDAQGITHSVLGLAFVWVLLPFSVSSPRVLLSSRANSPRMQRAIEAYRLSYH